MIGGEGNDLLIARGALDATLVGGAGDDTFFLSSDAIVDAEEGADHYIIGTGINIFQGGGWADSKLVSRYDSAGNFVQILAGWRASTTESDNAALDTSHYTGFVRNDVGGETGWIMHRFGDMQPDEQLFQSTRLSDRGIPYLLQDNDLIISGQSEAIIIQDFHNGDFGIELVTVYFPPELNEDGVSIGAIQAVAQTGLDDYEITPLFYAENPAVPWDQFNEDVPNPVENIQRDPIPTVTGTPENDTLSGSNNNDVLIGGEGNDILFGNLGNDVLFGNGGNDIYRFRRGDGEDVIEDNGSGEADRIEISGYTPDQVTFSQIGDNDLRIDFDVVAPAAVSGQETALFAVNPNNALPIDSIVVRNAFADTDEDRIEFITFEDGTELTIGSIARSLGIGNDAPVVANALVDQSSDEDTAVSFIVPENTFDDIDGDSLILGATLDDGSALPTWLVFDSTTRSFNGTPPTNFNGTLSVTVLAFDGALSVSDTFDLVITAVNDAPIVFNPLVDQSSDEDTVVSFVVPANTFSDIDGDTLTLSATLDDGSALPTWLVFDSTLRSFNGTPPVNFNGTLSVTVLAFDGALSVSDTFDLVITPVNDAPVAQDDSGFVFDENTDLTITAGELLANDSDICSPSAPMELNSLIA